MNTYGAILQVWIEAHAEGIEATIFIVFMVCSMIGIARAPAADGRGDYRE